MAGRGKAPKARQALLVHSIVKKVREARRMTPAQVAAGMGLSLRAYQDFEAGKWGFEFDKVRRFSKATGVDYIALVDAIALGRPELATLCMDNKMLTVQVMGVSDLHEMFGDRLATVPPQLVLGMARLFSEEIAKLFERQDANAEDFLLKAVLERAYADPDAEP